MNKEELIDFGIWISKNDKILENGNIEETVNEYLKSLNSDALIESQSVSENENQGKESVSCYDIPDDVCIAIMKTEGFCRNCKAF